MFQRLARLRGPRTRAGFERCVQRLLPELYRTARTYVHEPADAEDLVHDSCVKAFRAFPGAKLASEAACRAWLHRILVNTFRDRYRRETRSPAQARPADREGDNVVELAASPEPGPSTRLEYANFGDAARAAIATLPPEVRVVAALYVIDGLSYREIAAITGCPIGTVMSRLARGRQTLRRSLARYASVEARDPRKERSQPEPNSREGQS